MSEYPSTEYKVGYETGYRDALHESKKIAMEIASWLDSQIRVHAESNVETLFSELKSRLESENKPLRPDTEEHSPNTMYVKEPSPGPELVKKY